MSESPNIRTRSARHRARLGERGMSLLELVIAMVVLTVGMLGSMIMILTGMQSNSRNKTDNAATVLDQEILEMFATLKNYPRTGSVIIYDCALSGGRANQHLASLVQGTYANGGNGAPPNSTGDIKRTQAAPTPATAPSAGYALPDTTVSCDI